MILGPSLIINLAQLEYPSVALLAELVSFIIIFSHITSAHMTRVISRTFSS